MFDEQPIKRTGADEVTHEGLRVAENPNLVISNRYSSPTAMPLKRYINMGFAR